MMNHKCKKWYFWSDNESSVLCDKCASAEKLRWSAVSSTLDAVVAWVLVSAPLMGILIRLCNTWYLSMKLTLDQSKKCNGFVKYDVTIFEYCFICSVTGMSKKRHVIVKFQLIQSDCRFLVSVIFHGHFVPERNGKD